MTGSASLRLAGIAVVLTAALALAAPRTPVSRVSRVVVAAEPRVAVQADIVYASTKPGEVDPTLKKMQDTLGAKVKYLTLKKLSTRPLELELNKPQPLPLPNQKEAVVRLVSLKDGVATVGVALAPGDTTYTLGREKSIYLQAGPHDGGELWLVLSQPR